MSTRTSPLLEPALTISCRSASALATNAPTVPLAPTIRIFMTLFSLLHALANCGGTTAVTISVFTELAMKHSSCDL